MAISRRDILKGTIATFGTLGAASALGRVGEMCGLTPPQPEGPFYPVLDQSDKNNDLTLLGNRSERAQGEVIFVQGVVTDASCAPVAKAVVEIWQACASGRYNHPGDQDNSNPLDPNFQYWGITTTNEKGEYWFKTILPGHYNANETWVRPPHIHFKVHKRGYLELTTQMYFAGNRFNDADLILKRIPAEERDSVIVQMQAREQQDGFDCHFNISLVRLT